MRFKSGFIRYLGAAAFVMMVLAAAIFFVAPEPVIEIFGIESSDLVEGSKFAARVTVVGLVLGGLASFLPQELPAGSVRCPVVKRSEADLLADRSALVKSFELEGGSLFDAAIFDCGERAYLLSNFHHLICDGYSFPLILADAHKAWDGTLEEPLRLPASFADFLAAHRTTSRLPGGDGESVQCRDHGAQRFHAAFHRIRHRAVFVRDRATLRRSLPGGP